ncbi:hypothetical protein E3T55_05145 [Cryobacterium frigoriphilum]|uniref:Uncharacterized protein n=1 Tax=Cryobacterium frigoriphilum TaxID=1259150 RepID=A0A4R9A772_9MICO|nr:hypothetical protein [Cryobacterium frigoriphilum]TFD53547.1 hypothetical protein E3T55_05145 [Cryobacterium frigoriphilum]
MRTPSVRTRRIMTMTVAPVAILVAGLMVWQGSNAAFTASTRNSDNNWSTGSVALVDDDGGTAAFQVTNLKPGATGTKCIVVTASSSLAGVVRPHVSNLSLSGRGLAERVTLTLERGTGGSFSDCTGFVATETSLPAASLKTLADNNSSFATGGLPWSTAGVSTGESQTYRGTWAFNTTGMTQLEIDALQGSQTSIDLVWELQNS